MSLFLINDEIQNTNTQNTRIEIDNAQNILIMVAFKVRSLIYTNL